MKSGTGAGSPRGGRLTGALVVFQFALTVVLLAGAGLMMRSFLAAQQINPFMPAAEILAARVHLPDRPGERYESVEARKQMHDRLLARLAAIPGATHTAVTSDFPALGAPDRTIELEGREAPDPKQPLRATVIFASPSYLPAIALPVLTGRGLGGDDGETGKEVAVVTRAFAARHWPNESALGRRFRLTTGSGEPGPWMTVVGVSADLIQNTQERHAPPVVFLSHRQEPWAWLGLLVRTSGDPAALTSAVRAAVQELDADLPLFDVRPLPQLIERQHWFLRVFGTLFFTFAAMALLMASVGIYAVVAQTTARRTREIGIRIALGASTAGVVRLVLSRGLIQLGLGLATGFAGAFAATQLLDSVIGLVSPTDPVVFGSVAVLLGVVGLLACWLPARRAARVAPTEALRTE